jgi:diguanylate cyclase (GGDEF)-like protein
MSVVEGDRHLQELANSMLGAVVAHVRAVGGEDAVARVLREAGEERSAAELQDPNGWSTYGQGLSLFTAAARVLDDPDVGRKAGVEVVRQYAGSEIITLLRSLGSPAEILRIYPAIQAKQSTVTRAEVIEVADDHGSVSVTTCPPITRDQLFCGYTAGALSQLPVLFGMAPAVVHESECQTLGSARCVFEVAWDPTSALGTQADAEQQLLFLRNQVALLTTRFESLEVVAKELSSAQDVGTVLATITRHAGVAVRAPRYLLAVRLPGDADLRVHHVGFAEGEARAVANLVLTSAEEDGGSRLIVDVASARTHFGRLAAFYPEGYHFMPQERSLFLAYADHAAAALETVAALHESRERNATLSALLALGRELAEVTTRQELGERVAATTPEVVGCREAHVLLWDPEDAILARTATHGHSSTAPTDALRRGLRGERLAGRMLEITAPATVSSSSDPELQGVLDLTGLDRALIVPLTTRNEFIGLLVIGAATRPEGWTEVTRERLAGIAGLASTALGGLALLDEVRHQAFHDSITNLPNTRLFEDRISQAITTGRRTGSRHGFLFVDLDRFKTVNDGHGHKMGDDLIREVAKRLTGCVRDTDTVARVGGDEFAVLVQDLREIEDAAAIARKIVATLQRPFTIRGMTLMIGASVGITVFPTDMDTYERVLSRADSAMYEAKARGRGQYRFCAESTRTN